MANDWITNAAERFEKMLANVENSLAGAVTALKRIIDDPWAKANHVLAAIDKLESIKKDVADRLAGHRANEAEAAADADLREAKAASERAGDAESAARLAGHIADRRVVGAEKAVKSLIKLTAHMDPAVRAVADRTLAGFVNHPTDAARAD